MYNSWISLTLKFMCCSCHRSRYYYPVNAVQGIIHVGYYWARDFKGLLCYLAFIIKIIIKPSCFCRFGSFLYTSDDTRFPIGVHICPCCIRRHTRLGTQSSLSFTVAGINASELEITSLNAFMRTS